ncbi:MAG: hypothetical protein J6033_06440 [Lachnospiraceae bacterium]|nr:hypothetical protein [Lachnospiraceae bacterium]
MKKRLISLLLAVTMVFATACTDQKNPAPEAESAVEETVEAEEAEESAEAASDETEAAEETAAETAEETAERVSEQPEWAKDAVVYEVNIRQYTAAGTFDAFAERLDTLVDMGVNVLWIMPIYPISLKNRSGHLGSYYSITDYREVNPEFGDKDSFKALVDAAHEKGMYIMLDWVANHTGWDSAWITDHPDWYTQDANRNIISPENMGWPDVADLNYDNYDMRAEMIECMKYWVENFDVDGFRCDYATGVPQDFWEDAREALEAIKPVYMLAEDNMVVGLLDYAFDMNYNWDLYDAMVGVAKGMKTADKLRLYVPEKYPEGTYSLNFMDNHDKNSYERTIMGGFGSDALPAFFTYMFMIPGVPMIYTGDEIGLDHAIAFTSKDAVRWDSSEYDYRELLGHLATIRHENPALYSGTYGGKAEYFDSGSKNIVAFSREKDGNVIKLIVNLCKRDSTGNFADFVSDDSKVILHGCTSGNYDFEETTAGEYDLSGEVTLAPWEFFVISE